MSFVLTRPAAGMHPLRARIARATLLVFSVALCGSAFAAEQQAPSPAKPDKAPAKIGVYDSRAIAVAYAGSKVHEAQLRVSTEKLKTAKAEGNTAQIAELESQAQQQQKELHRQGFSTAPVDKLLALVKDEVARITSDKGVGALVSKWDKEALAKYPDAKQVDVTMALVDAFHPNERQRKSAEEVLKHKPIPLDELEKLLEKEGH